MLPLWLHSLLKLLPKRFGFSAQLLGELNFSSVISGRREKAKRSRGRTSSRLLVEDGKKCVCAPLRSELCLRDVTTGETTMTAEAARLQRGSIVLAGQNAAAAAQMNECGHRKSATKLQLPFNVRILQLGLLCLRQFVECWKRKAELQSLHKPR